MYLLQAFNLLDRCAPDSAPKAVFTIGGPGAGKSYSIHLVLKDLEVNADSLIKIDPDDVLEKLFDNKNSVDTRRIHINPLTDKMYEVALRTKKSFISDGTGRNFAMISKRVAECKLQGFKTILVITAPATSRRMTEIENRAARTGRSVQKDFIENTYMQLKTHIPFYMRIADATYLYANTYDGKPLKVITSNCGKKSCHFSKDQMKDIEEIIDVSLFCPRQHLQDAITRTVRMTRSQDRAVASPSV